MKLNIVIPTFNRSSLLRKTLTSLERAEKSPDLEVTVTVVDNNSTDDTREVVRERQTDFKLGLRYLFEPRQGQSRALNTGIRSADGDLVGLIDDDVEVAPDWFLQIARLFGERWDEVDFASGKVLPLWETPPPKWLPPNCSGVLGLFDSCDQERAYDPCFDAMLPGCHSLVKLSALKEVGLYNEDWGPMGNSLVGHAGGADDDLFDRLISGGKRGLYSPKLVIHHFVPSYRLTKHYFRHWSYGHGVSQGSRDAARPSYSGPRILGTPRYLYGDAMRAAFRMLRALTRRDAQAAFADEAPIWILTGFLSSRHHIFSPLGKIVRAIRG